MLSVLVIDRESDIRGLFETILKRMGHRIKTQEFLDNNESDREEYDLIIFDLWSFEQRHKPLLDAYTCRKLCALSICKEESLPSDIGVEYDYYLQKPFGLDSFKKIIDSLQ